MLQPAANPRAQISASASVPWPDFYGNNGLIDLLLVLDHQAVDRLGSIRSMASAISKWLGHVPGAEHPRNLGDDDHTDKSRALHRELFDDLVGAN